MEGNEYTHAIEIARVTHAMSHIFSSYATFDRDASILSLPRSGSRGTSFGGTGASSPVPISAPRSTRSSTPHGRDRPLVHVRDPVALGARPTRPAGA